MPTSADVSYRLWDGVQVRREEFGLLFYDYRGPRLYFVPSKDLVGDTFFDGQRTVSELIESVVRSKGLPRSLVSDRVRHILDLLKAKGLIYEQ